MELTSIINAIPQSPDLEADTYKDNRTKLHLLYRDGRERIDALITPFGDNLRGKNNLTTYLRFLPNRRILSSTFQDAEIEEAKFRDGSKYLTICDEERKAVLPFKTKGEFPYVIMPGSFASDITQCNERVLRSLIRMLESIRSLSTREFVDLSDGGMYFLISRIFM